VSRQPKRRFVNKRPPTERLNVEASKLRLLGIALLGMKLVLVPLIFDLSYDVPFTVLKVLLSHSIAYALAGVLLGLLIRHGRTFFVWSWLHIPVLAFLVANVLATLFGVDRVLSLYGAHVRMLGLGTIADYVVLYIAVVLLVRSRREAVALIACIVAASIVVLAYEAVQLAGQDPLRWTTDTRSRPFSTVGQSTSLTQYLTVVSFAALLLGVLFQKLPPVIRGLTTLYAVVLLVGAVATGGRSGLLGFASGGALLVLLVWFLHPSKHARLITVSGATLAAAAVVALLVLTPLGARVASTIQTVTSNDLSEEPSLRLEPSAAGRAELYGTAFRMIQERPLLGYGPDSFAVGVPKYRPEAAEFVRRGPATSAHSWVTHVASTSGLIGLGAFLGVVLTALALTLQGGFRPVAISGAVMLVSVIGTGLTTINDIVGDSLFWTSVGMVAVGSAGLFEAPAVAGQSRRVKRSNAHDSSLRQAAALVCVAAGMVLALSTANALAASRFAEASRDMRIVGRVNEAIEAGVSATRADDGRPEYWDVLGLAYVAAARWAEASRAFDRAIALAPYELRYVADLALVQLILLSSGDNLAKAKSIELAERAVAIDPNNPRAHELRAQIMQATSNLVEARRSIQRALELDPQSTDAQLYIIAARLATGSGRPDEAIEIARVGIGVLGTTSPSLALRIELARALLAVNQPMNALIEIDAALAIQPSDPSAQQIRREILAALQR
jgi:O-antigen ligase